MKYARALTPRGLQRSVALMAKDKKVEQITDMEVDFAQWFTDVCTKAELVDYSDVKGLFILRPYGYAIWENIQKILDGKFKATGHQNVSMPMLIPESLLQKEKDHVEGFAPECAWVTMGGSEELPERLCVRPMLLFLSLPMDPIPPPDIQSVSDSILHSADHPYGK